MKTLKESGVPFGARCVFRLQHLGSVVAMVTLLACVIAFLPVLLFLAVTIELPVEALLDRLRVLVEERTRQLEVHRAKLIRMYSKEHS